jgi:hypothetical protein
MVPPPSTVNMSCVYIVRRSDGYFYCGESDDIRGTAQAPKCRSIGTLRQEQIRTAGGPYVMYI